MVTVREMLGMYSGFPLEFSFQAADTAGTFGDRGADHADVVLAATMPTDGCIHAWSVNAVGGNLVAADFLIHVNGSPVAASAFTVDGAAAGTGGYVPGAVEFEAGQTIQVEIDDLTTMRDCVVTLWVILNVGE